MKPRLTSNNGGQTRPLTLHAREVLALIAIAPIPCTNANHGVVDRLTRGLDPLCEYVPLPSPFKKDRRPDGTVATCTHLRILPAGLTELASR